MKQYTEQELEKNYNTFMGTISKAFSGERLKQLQNMYSMEHLGPNLMVSPASSFKHFHNAYEGGYIDHVMGVVQNSLKVLKMYESMGGMIDFDKEELVFAAFHHDLGKLGDEGETHFIPNESEWHVKNQGKVYVTNPNIDFLSHTDRTFYLLQKYDVKYSTTEYLGIKLTDGLYDADNEKYLKVFSPEKFLKTNIQFILHWADHMTTCIERDKTMKAPF